MFPQTWMSLPSSYQFIFTPDGFSVARFIKYSREHTQKLKDAFSSLANVEVFEQKSVKKVVEYRFRPVQRQLMTEQEFDYRCTECLLKFLENYSFKKRCFNHERLDKVAEQAPDFFENMSGRDNGELHVQWHLSDYLVILSGLKHKVEEKEAEIIQFFDEVAPRKSMQQSSRPVLGDTRSVSSRFVFKLPARDFSVARFLQQSRINFSKLEIITRDFATVKLWNVFDRSDETSNKHNQKKKEIEYRFKPIPNCELSEDEFETQCKSTLQDFLDLYLSTNKFFNHEHLMKAVKKDPDFFNNQSPREREALYVDWRLDRNKVLLTGLKSDVDRKLEEITTHLDQLVPRFLKELYEFDVDPPNLIAVKFVKENDFYLDTLRGSLKNARVWIPPGTFKLRFKATVQLQQHDIPQFEEDCKSAADGFLRKFYTRKFSPALSIVETTVKQNPRLFKRSETDWKCEVSDENEIILVGLKSVFFKKRSEIQTMLAKSEAIQNPKKKKLHRDPCNDSAADDSSVENSDRWSPFVYEPKGKANLNILKHVFENPLAVNELQCMVGSLVQFKVLSKHDVITGITFFPTPGSNISYNYYTNALPKMVVDFFARFLVCGKRCKNPRERASVLAAVDICRQNHSIPERVLSVLDENGFLNVVGPRPAIAELAEIIDGTKCEGLRVQLQRQQLPGSFRRQSSSSDANEPRTLNKNKTSNKANFVASKNQNEKKNLVDYRPKQKHLSAFTFAWENDRFRKELKSRCNDMCDLMGTTEKFQVVQKNLKLARPMFMKEVVKKLDEFFDSIAIELISLDSDVVQYFEENEKQWLKDHRDPQDWVVINCNGNGIELMGFKDDVNKYKSIIEKQLERTVNTIEATPEIIRTWSVCGVVAETNRQLKGKAVVSYSLEDATVSFSGRRCFLESARNKLDEVDQLVKKVPITTPQKLEVLAVLKENNGEELQMIEKKMAEKNIKCVLLLQSGKVILTAMTEEMFSKGSKFLDQLIRSVDIPNQDGIPANTFTGKAWNDLVSKLTASNTVFVSLQNSYITLSAFDQDALSDAAAEVKKSLDSLLFKTREIPCQGLVTRFVMTFHAQKKLTLTQTKSGLQINGSAKDVDKCCWNFESKDIVVKHFFKEHSKHYFHGYGTPLLRNLGESPGLDASSLTPHLNLLLISIHRAGKTPSRYWSKKFDALYIVTWPSTSQSRDSFDINNVQVTSYDRVMVSVRHGDICDDDSDVIVNGVISSDFDLSRGAVSSSLLRQAGRNLQHECDAADKSSPVIRHTRGCNLRCSHVIHVVTPNQPDVLAQRLKDVLDHAELLRAKSVALPTLGAEMMKFWKRAIKASKLKYKSLLRDEVTVYINCDDPTNMQQAKTRIKQLMSDTIITKRIEVESFSDLDDHDRSDIYEAAVKHKARVGFDSLSSEIILKGLQANVNQLYDVTREMMYELREATTLSKMFVWKWDASSGLFTALPLRVSRALERKYEVAACHSNHMAKTNLLLPSLSQQLCLEQKSKSGSHHVTMYGSYFVVDFSKMTYDFKTITGQLKREDSEKIPPSWKDMMGKPWLKVPLDRSSSEYNRVLKLFEASNPQHTRIVNIERIQNPSLYKQYLIKKNEVQRHMTSKEPVERELFHGTSAEDAKKICADNFDRSFSGKNATVYGKGCYFAVQSSYSVHYASTQLNTLSCVFLAQVLTGDFCKGDSSMKSPPDNLNSGDISRKYDSVVDNQSSPTIFVVFKDTSVYPAYLITFI